jgi:hypothetical protein
MRRIRPLGFPAVLSFAVAALLLGATPAAALQYDLEFKREPGIAPGFMGPAVVGSVTASNGYCGTNFGYCSFTLKVFRRRLRAQPGHLRWGGRGGRNLVRGRRS